MALMLLLPVLALATFILDTETPAPDDDVEADVVVEEVDDTNVDAV